jgi:hypothetical protein
MDMRIVFLVTGAICLLTATAASAQYPGGPMDQPGAFNTQVYLGYWGQIYPRILGMQAYNYTEWLRSQGYTGPSPQGHCVTQYLSNGLAYCEWQ